MEQFVLGIFQEQLSKFILGFRKEQVNANLLNGKGEIHNVELNCSFLNEELGRMAPYIEFESVFVSKISFHVTSWTNLRKAPIVIDIEHIRACAVEPFRFMDRRHRKEIQQMMNSELERLIKAGLVPKWGGPYGLFDRIMDNLTLEIASVSLEYQTAGKFKTRRRGPWTPPMIQLRFAGIRIAPVNEYGQEAPPDEVWHHNHYRGVKNFMLYKKLSLEYQIFLTPYNSSPIPLIAREDNRLEIQVAVERRLRDGAFLKVQIDVTILQLEIDAPSHVVPLLAHAVAGLTFCFAKDRSFVDPLKAVEAKSENSDNGEESEDQYSDIVSVASSDVPEEFFEESDGSSEDQNEIDRRSWIQRSDTTESAAKNSIDYPVLLIPDALVIREKLSVSVAISHAGLRGTYADGDHVQVVVKGIVGELIWPREGRQKGGYAQASIAFVSIKERNDKKNHPLLIGGTQFDSSSAVDRPAQPLSDVGRDVTFPLYEDRSIRMDPFGLRHSFPAQALGIKTTVEFVARAAAGASTEMIDGVGEEEVRFINEVGVEHVKVFADAYAWTRVLRFVLHMNEGGFDQRWYTGDWGNILTTEMLVRSNETLNLKDHLQPTKQIFLDENHFISSDLFNLTARINDVCLRIPAAISTDLRSCDIVVSFDELMPVVSSALPRTFLSGKIGSSVNGDDSPEKGIIRFPNDPSDIAYQMEQSEDPSNRQRGVQTTQQISTFRMQVTVRGLSVKLEPIVPYCDADTPKKLLAPVELTFLVCFEGFVPKEPKGKSVNLVLFSSGQIHELAINLDLDLLASACGTATFHLRPAKEIARNLSVFFAPAEIRDHSERKGPANTRLGRGIRGRRISIRRHLQRSRVTGGLSVAVAVQIAKSSIVLWREDVPMSSPYRPLPHSHSTSSQVPKAARKICSFGLFGYEFGWEFKEEGSEKKDIYKFFFSEICLQACSEDVQSGPYDELFTIFAIGKPDTDNGISIRIEDMQQDNRRVSSIAVDSEGGCLYLLVQELETTALLILEALLMTTSAQNHGGMETTEKEFFPPGSVGALLERCFRCDHRNLDLENIAPHLDERVAYYGLGSFQEVASRLLPGDIDCFFLMIELHNFQLVCPGQKSLASICLEIRAAELLVALDLLGGRDCPLLDTFCKGESTWRSMLQDRTAGLWYRLSSWQGLGLLRESLANEYLVQPFKLAVTSEGTSLEINFSKGIILDAAVDIGSMAAILIEFSEKCSSCLTSTHRVLYSWSSESKTSKDADSPVSLACCDTASVMTSVARILEEVKEKAYVFLDAANTSIKKLADENRQLQEIVFKKERDLFAVVAHLSAQISGWLRWGAARRTGQRGLFSSSLWSHWLVLWRNLLLVYKHPGSFRPIDIIQLRGASLIELKGSLRKRDLKRAFALTDSTGTIHFISTSSDREYHEWIQSLRKTITSCTPVDELSSTPEQSSNTVTPTLAETRGGIGIDYDDIDVEDSMDSVSPEKYSSVQRDNLGLRSKVFAGARAKLHGTSFPFKQLIRRRGPSEDIEDAKNVDVSERKAAAAPEGITCNMCTFLNAKGTSACEMCNTSLVEVASESVYSFPDAIDSEIKVNGKVSRSMIESGEVKGDAIEARSLKNTENSKYSIEDTALKDIDESEETAKAEMQRGDHTGEKEATSQVVENSMQRLECTACTYVNDSESISCQICGHVLCSEESCGVAVARARGAIYSSNRVNSVVEENTPKNRGMIGRIGAAVWGKRETDSAPGGDSASAADVQDDKGESERTIGTDLGEFRKHELTEMSKEPPNNIDQGLLDDFTINNDAKNDDGALAYSTHDAALENGVGMRERLQNVVKKTRKGLSKNADDSDPRKATGGRRGFFSSIRTERTESNENSRNASQQPLELKNVSFVGNVPTPIDPLGTLEDARAEVAFKSFKGVFSVNVSAATSSDKPNKHADENFSPDVESHKDPASVETKKHRMFSHSPDGSELRSISQSVSLGVENTVGYSSSDDANIAPEEHETELGESDTTTKELYKDAESRTFRVNEQLYRIQLLKRGIPESGASECGTVVVAEFTKNSAGILALHTTISESVAQSTLQQVNADTLETVQSAANILGGILEVSLQTLGPPPRHACEIIAEYLSTMLACPLPTDALQNLGDFLGVSEDNSESTSLNSKTHEIRMQSPLELTDGLSMGSLVRLLSQCETQLHRAQRQNKLSEQLATEIHRRARDAETTDTIISPKAFVANGTSTRYQNAMHVALMQAMEERDEAHARLVASNVLHVHEMEKQRKRVNQLELQLSRQATAAPAESRNRVTNCSTSEQSMEEELLSLCQQLAREISDKTEAELEVARLKEVRQIERKNEQAETEGLREEIESLKTQLQREKEKAFSALEEVHSWKKYVKDVMES